MNALRDVERTKDDLWGHLHKVHYLKMPGPISHYTKIVLVEIHREAHKAEGAITESELRALWGDR